MAQKHDSKNKVNIYLQLKEKYGIRKEMDNEENKRETIFLIE